MVERNSFEENARGVKARRLTAFLIEEGCTVAEIDSWDESVWELMADGATEFCGVKVHRPSPDTVKMVRNYFVGHEERERIRAARRSVA